MRRNQKPTELRGGLDQLFEILILLSLLIYKTSRQKISKNVEELNNAISQLDLIDLYKHSATEYINTIFQVSMDHPSQSTISCALQLSLNK